MMLALDTSILAYAVNRYAPEHSRAARVVEDLAEGEAPWALPVSVVHEFLRLVTHRHAVARPLRPAEAWGFLRLLIECPAFRLLAATRDHAAAIEELLGNAGADPSWDAGFETAVLLREHGVRELLSSDTSMRRFRFLTVIDPLPEGAWPVGPGPLRRYRRLTTGVS